MAAPGATTFGEALSRAPMRAFQWVTVAICMLVLVSDGIDMQLLGIVAPLVIKDFGVDKGTFGIAMSAALVGFGLGAWGGGWLGDRIGRRFTLALAALVFALATVAASQADGVWHMALWRVLGGLGFGAAYSNALAMASEWLPDRLRPVTISTLSVGTPIGGTVVGWLGPTLAADYGWRGAFVAFGIATLLLVIIILATLRDSPSYLLARGKTEAARRAARHVLAEDVPLLPERHEGDAAGLPAIGVLHRTNLRLNIGVGTAFAAFAGVAYGILNWSTTFLTASGFTLAQAGGAVSVGGITSMAGSVLAGMLTRRFGSRRVMTVMSVTLLTLLVALAFVVETLPDAPTAAERLTVVTLIGAAAAVFSGGIAIMYVIMIFGYPQSCRSAGIGFGIFMSRVGAISASGFGGALLDFGQGSTIPFFATLCACSVLVLAAVVIIDRHVPPAGVSS
ncbi:MFS transporter [Sphingobium nicotianae]|uniref:MFS transporter n=1 Tax=Sphingobium nicotianae TaxID=2782607 RepID=A0A9X1IQL6_9SPHN|nr:MFS transporter [Sphingobium nicotianae]MBT2186721.1 MFS transporter [Sphingobium nicotianae]